MISTPNNEEIVNFNRCLKINFTATNHICIALMHLCIDKNLLQINNINTLTLKVKAARVMLFFL